MKHPFPDVVRFGREICGDLAAAERREFYRSSLLPLSQRVADAAQKISDMNLHNMVAVDGQDARVRLKGACHG